MLLIYSRYLNDIINNELNAVDLLDQVLQQIGRIKKINRMTIDNEDVMFGENSFSCMFMLQTDQKTIGKIDFVNEEVEHRFGYTA